MGGMSRHAALVRLLPCVLLAVACSDGPPVRVADPFSRVKVSKKVRERDQIGSFAIAVGLGIED